METNKTDLTKILAISGQHGLFRYLGQARNGAIVEALSDGKRGMFSAHNKITTLEDISIYTEDGELKLRQVLLKLKEVLGDKPAPTAKSPSSEITSLFLEAVPDYDAGRFYLSHMKKVVEWYNELKKYASLDFTDEETPAEETDSEE